MTRAAFFHPNPPPQAGEGEGGGAPFVRKL